MTTFEPTAPAQLSAVHQQDLTLPLGLLGFEQIKKFLLLSRTDEAPFSWLQVLQEPHLSFLVLPPFYALAQYQPSFGADDVDYLGLNASEDALLYGIVTLRPNQHPTINLKGPILVNRHTWIGKQAILTNAADYSLQHPLPVGNEHFTA